jgi:hypothetical protein
MVAKTEPAALELESGGEGAPSTRLWLFGLAEKHRTARTTFHTPLRVNERADPPDCVGISGRPQSEYAPPGARRSESRILLQRDLRPAEVRPRSRRLV